MADLGDYVPSDVFEFGALFSDEEPPASGARPSQSKNTAAGETSGLGIDEEVSVKKRVREPRVKLDESRLLSTKGIPALRKRSRVLKLKGKGHEFSDAARLLSMYQLWLDDLFPKARFGDALAMVEREGHKSNMHKMRMEWINESRPKGAEDVDAGMHEGQLEYQAPLHELQTQAPPTQASRTQPQRNSSPTKHRPQPGTENGLIVDEPTEEDILFWGEEDHAYTAEPQAGERITPQAADEIPDEDELDALMAEAMEVHAPIRSSSGQLPTENSLSVDFDDLDALVAEAEAIAQPRS